MSADGQEVSQDSLERARNLKFQPGDLIVGRYEYICELDRYGAGGIVCLCRDTNAGGTAMALKTMPDVLRQNEAECAAIKSTFQKVLSLNHEGIAAIRSLVEDDFRQYVVMDYVTGFTLGEYRKEHPHLDTGTVKEIVKRLASALDYAHGKGMIHRNVKPGNVMVDIDDHGIVRNVKILDFGLGQQIRESVARATGKKEEEIPHEYFSPEQWSGTKLNAATDQYSLAVLAYEMLSGRRPFQETGDALKKAILENVPKEIPGVPKSINDALLKALSLNASDRFASCGDFSQAFSGKKIVATEPAQKKSKKDEEVGSGRTNGFAKWLAVAAVVIVVVVAAILLTNAKNKDMDQKAIEAKRPAETSNVLQITAAKEAEAKEAARKNISDEAPKSTEIQLTPEQAKQKQETLLLRSSLIRMKKTLDGQMLNRSQTFGAHLDTFADQINAGDTAIKDNDFAVATLCFEAAKKEYDWLQAAIGPRKDAMAKLAVAEEDIKKAEKVDAMKFAAADFTKAKADFEEGRKAYESADFAKASGLLESSAKACKAAFAEASSARLTELVAAAKASEAAGSEKDWKDVLKFAADMKPLDAALAAEWEAKADAKLPPTLTIVTMFNGREVHASMDGTDVMTPWKSSVLKKGETVSHYLVWWYDNDEYVADFNTTVNWKGSMKETVVLRKKVVDLRSGYILLPLKEKIELVKVEGGTFDIGGNANNPRTVTLTHDYWIGKYEISQGQWKSLGLNKKVACRWENDGYPVENVSWNEAMAFCEQLNQLTKGQLPKGYHFTLPTEAEWEYAARGGVKSRGYEYSGGNMLEKVGWFWLNAGGKPHPVKGKKVKMGNELGIYDMSGNVLEWCRDSCDIDTKNLVISAFAFSNGVEDPICRSGVGRVVRGGSWQSSHAICRTVYRFGYMSDDRKDNVGFRVVLSPIR